MKNRPLLIAILTAVFGAGVAIILLRPPVYPAPESPQARVFTAAAAFTTPPPAVAPGPVSEKDAAVQTAVNAAVAGRIGAFMENAPRTPEGGRRIAMLRRLKQTLSQRELAAIRHEQAHPPADDAGLFPPSIRYPSLAEEVAADLDLALRDPTTLTPEIRQLYDRQAAHAWRDPPPLFPAPPEQPAAPANNTAAAATARDFEQYGDSLAQPLLQRYVDLYCRWSDKEWLSHSTHEETPAAAAARAKARSDFERLRNLLYNHLMETEDQRQEWTAKNWQGWAPPERRGE